MFDRRSLLGATAAVSSFVAAAFGRGAAAKTDAKEKRPMDLEPRGTMGRLERLPDLALESRQEFLTEFRGWVNTDLSRAMNKRAEEIAKAKGIDVKAEFPLNRVAEVFGDDPLLMTYVRCWLSNQEMTWGQIKDAFYADADKYLSEMEAWDKAGPGTLELNPDMKLPDYTKHEIHIQPGGYVGDEFAGHINYYGVNNFYAGKNYQDEVQRALAAAFPLPADGKVKRILDMGCGIGRLTMALKERFPEAEVWGIDAGGPMVRFGHMRAADLGVEVHFAQRLAEDTKFPDGHFDMIISYIMFHEVTAEAAKQIVAEAHRVLRPGGVFFPIDFATGSQRPPMTPSRAFSIWWDHRWNNEVWRLQYGNSDFAANLRAAGFVVDESVPSARRGHGGLLATKPA
jgi:ubiquinone/menaquinone biosynthesis C-methylase UbiE